MGENILVHLFNFHQTLAWPVALLITRAQIIPICTHPKQNYWCHLPPLSSCLYLVGHHAVFYLLCLIASVFMSVYRAASLYYSPLLQPTVGQSLPSCALLDPHSLPLYFLISSLCRSHLCLHCIAGIRHVNQSRPLGYFYKKENCSCSVLGSS